MARLDNRRAEVWRVEIASWHIPIRTLIVGLFLLMAVVSAILAILQESPTNLR
jgi:hypothetical protein